MLMEVRKIANSNDSVLMQGLVHGRRSVRGHPKARLKLGAIKHQNFLFGMEMIRPQAVEVCNKFSTLLDLEGCSGDCIAEESQSSKLKAATGDSNATMWQVRLRWRKATAASRGSKKQGSSGGGRCGNKNGKGRWATGGSSNSSAGYAVR
ncbi:hypothetical protein BHE74_00005539 [Ensete ventricosum]|nr:hypothetical protein BHE74_00005539 [Ensete ventricosum]RZR82939.1 hypothetical protein BHM03_00009469 [Ensete ventricosum]